MIIYVITHKDYKHIAKSNLYQTLLVGADQNKCNEDCLKDNDFEDNISYKNKSFCELTGLYWIWKRSKEDYIGICHYRRYFATSGRFGRFHLLTYKKAFEILKNNNIILPLRDQDLPKNAGTIKEDFAYFHDANVWEKCEKIISEKTPELLNDFIWFENQKKGFYYNMMICKKELFDQYCEWLFPILFELEKQVDLSQYDAYNQRMFGFVAERLLNVWVHHQNYKIKELPVYFVDKPLIEKISNKLHSIFKRNRGE